MSATVGAQFSWEPPAMTRLPAERISAISALVGLLLIVAAFVSAGNVATAVPPKEPWIAALVGLGLIGLGLGLPGAGSPRAPHR